MLCTNNTAMQKYEGQNNLAYKMNLMHTKGFASSHNFNNSWIEQCSLQKYYLMSLLQIF